MKPTAMSGIRRAMPPMSGMCRVCAPLVDEADDDEQQAG